MVGQVEEQVEVALPAVDLRVSKVSSREIEVIMRATAVKRPTQRLHANIVTNADRRAIGARTAR